MQQILLEENVKNLKISEELRHFLLTNNIESFRKLTNYSGIDIMQMEGFSYRLLYEILDFLNHIDCLSLLKEK